jgi:hypothetical protein
VLKKRNDNDWKQYTKRYPVPSTLKLIVRHITDVVKKMVKIPPNRVATEIKIADILNTGSSMSSFVAKGTEKQPTLSGP